MRRIRLKHIAIGCLIGVCSVLWYALSEHFPAPTLSQDVIDAELVANEFKLTSHIRSGCCGSVYAGRSIHTNGDVAIKMENGKRKSTLQKEYNILKMFNGTVGVPTVYWQGSFLGKQYNAMVMQRLGSNLNDAIRKRNDKKYNHGHRPTIGQKDHVAIKNAVVIAIQTVSLLEQIHEKYIVHRDIKPHNFALGVGRHNSTVYIVDFGLSSFYRSSSGLHVRYTDEHSIAGTKGYMSHNALLGIEQSRRDDMEALGYVLLALYPGYTLPWREAVDEGEDSEGNDAFHAIERIMARTTLRDLCAGVPGEYKEYFRHVKSLGFFEKPNYRYLRTLFKNLYSRLKFGLYDDNETSIQL
eukprot:CAMPEP_0185031516 /NCGR_PEP_ID=MMETSP1103-20130426/19037_1 /TAXON_ID=36769 /ORGANISM="Paraphysomonas bandaiensis, Strain Caron Lab Isolate" /LENGTH=353 /DNA_ID=CAMNT_0027567061 /DNA_START=1 /DNA_END=1062 /DNA_ORIENTATION=-